jgi:hypothetical protein
MNALSDRRKYHRIPMEFKLEVAVQGEKGVMHREKTILEDISGAGARFITRQPHRFFQGQSIELTIYLPGTSDVAAKMRGQATVVRVDGLRRIDRIHKDRSGAIAVEFKTSLIFERLESIHLSDGHFPENPA